MPFKVVIPARYGSTRLPAKPLLEIGGKPMIAWVVEAAFRSGAEEVIVATDDTRIQRVVENMQSTRHALALLTRLDHASGTDRIAEVAGARGWSDATAVVNVQGDEPQLPSVLIDQVAALLVATQADIATLCTPIRSHEELFNPNVVKVVCGYDGHALYFSRAPIPYPRDVQAVAGDHPAEHAFRHLGLYAYRVSALKKMTQMPVGTLEGIEKLEQLRALEAGLRIAVASATHEPGMGVDTPEDLARLKASVPTIL